MPTIKMKQILTKRWVKVCSGVIVAFALFFLLLPLGVKYYLADWLQKNGADSATIEKLRFNPFIGKITLGGMDVQLGGRSIFHDAGMLLDLSFPALFNRTIQVEKAEYHDLSVDIEQYADGSLRIASYTVPNKPAEQDVVEIKNDAASAWNFLADQVTLKDCSVHLKTPELDMTLVIEGAELKRLTTHAEQPAGTFTFKGKLNDAPIVLQLDTVQIVPELRLGGNVSITAFQLDQLSRLLRDVLPTLAGKVGLEGKLLFSLGSATGILADYDGTVGIIGSDIGSGAFAIQAENLSWKGQLHYAGPNKGPMEIKTDGLFSVRDLNLLLPASKLAMKEARIDFGGKTTATIDKNILINNDGSLLLEGIELVLPPHGIVEESISWKGTVQYDSDYQEEGLFVRTDGFLNIGEFQIGGGEQAASFAMGGKMASWQGTAGLSQKDAGKLQIIELDGALVGGELRTTLAEPQLRLGQEKVELKTTSTINLGESMDIGGVSSLNLQNFTLYAGQTDSPLVAFEQMAVNALEGRGGKTIAVEDIQVQGVESSLPGDFPLNINIPEIRLADIFTDDLATFTVNELDVQGPLVTSGKNSAELVRLDKLAVKKFKFAEEAHIGMENVRLQNFAFLGSRDEQVKKTALSFADATLTAISWSNAAGLASDTLQFDDLVATVIRDKDGRINISQQLAEMQQKPGTESGTDTDSAAQQPAVSATTASARESRKTSFKLQKVVVAGKSGLFFEDYTLSVPYITDLSIAQLEITGLDSSKPDKKTEFILNGELEKRAPLAVSGSLFPFKEKPGVDMTLDLKNYPLSSLSAYTVQSVGTALASGQLQLKSRMALADDKLDMKNAIVLKKLETKTISPELSAELNNQLPIPLDAALSVLRDNKRNISLDIPLKGPLSELNVGISDVMITALSKAIVPAASGYLMYALGPYGALAYVGMKVGENMLQVRFPPVVFVQQETSLTEEHVKYLQRIGKILQDRPETDIQLCPQVASWEFLTEQEKTAIKGTVIPVDPKKQDELLELGQQRAEAVQALLEKDYDIARSRLLVCDTKIDTAKNAVPAILLQL